MSIAQTNGKVTSTSTQPIRGKIMEAEVKVSVSPAFPLPLASGLYAIDDGQGIWLCAYLPRKGADFDERSAGITFHTRDFIPQDQYQPALWEEFKKSRLMTFKPE